MDFNSLNAAEQAHMSKVIEKKQVCQLLRGVAAVFHHRFDLDARFHALVLRPGREMLSDVL